MAAPRFDAENNSERSFVRQAAGRGEEDRPLSALRARRKRINFLLSALSG